MYNSLLSLPIFTFRSIIIFTIYLFVKISPSTSELLSPLNVLFRCRTIGHLPGFTEFNPEPNLISSLLFLLLLLRSK